MLGNSALAQLALAQLPPEVFFASGPTYVGNYRFLEDHYVNNTLIPAGTVQEMAMPWLPTPNVEPLDTVAVNFFWKYGRPPQGIMRQIFTGFPVPKPVTYWQGIPTGWQLTGLGAGLPLIGP